MDFFRIEGGASAPMRGSDPGPIKIEFANRGLFRPTLEEVLLGCVAAFVTSGPVYCINSKQ
jgi:hypothetical protein